MYIPRHFAETDDGRLHELIDRYPFGTLVTCTNDAPFLSHIPFIRKSTRLVCHLARANPQVEFLRASDRVLCVFQGPHGYVSPSWYESPGVPTWNYAAVHVHGTASLIDDAGELAATVAEMARRFESILPEPWDPEFDSRMLSGIVGVHIRPTRIDGKFKLSQNKSAADRAGVARQLEAAGDDLSRNLARLMRERETND